MTGLKVAPQRSNNLFSFLNALLWLSLSCIHITRRFLELILKAVQRVRIADKTRALLGPNLVAAILRLFQKLSHADNTNETKSSEPWPDSLIIKYRRN